MVYWANHECNCGLQSNKCSLKRIKWLCICLSRNKLAMTKANIHRETENECERQKKNNHPGNRLHFDELTQRSWTFFFFVPHWLAVLLVFSETIWGDSLTSIWSSLELEAIAPCTRHRLCQYIAMHRTEKNKHRRSTARLLWIDYVFNSMRFQAFVPHINPSIVLLLSLVALCFWWGSRIFNTMLSIFGFCVKLIITVEPLNSTAQVIA